MTGDTDRLMLGRLRRIRVGQEKTDGKVDESTSRMGRVDLRLANVEVASLAARIDTLTGRIERIEHRLDLVEAP